MLKFTSNPRVPFELSSRRPRLAPLHGKPLIVQIVVNIEHWPFDQPMPRVVMTPPHGKGQIPDIPNFSWAEYGNRCGMPRLLHALGERGLKATASMNAGVIDAYPALAAAVCDAGWEFLGHGYHQRGSAHEQDERSHIGDALDKMRKFSGQRVRGWLGPGLSETFDTPDLLRENDIDYLMEWVVDDLPSWLYTATRPMIVVPYSLELNDSVVYAVEKQSSGEMAARVERTIATFRREIDRTGQPRVLTLPLHPHLSGVPHRIAALEQMLDALLHTDDTVFVTGSDIAAWFSDQCAPCPLAAA